MASLDELKRTFFDECGELLQEMEAGLTDLQDGSGSEDTVHAVFRAVHSIKGGAGIFGFEALVEFAHVFETVLDTVRHGSLTATPDVLAVLLTASDMLADLVAMSRSGEAIPAGHSSNCRAALEQLFGSGKSKAGEPPGKTAAASDPEQIDFTPVPAGETTGSSDIDGLDFTPVRADDFDGEPADNGDRTFTITFRPKPGMLRNANEPLFILRELRALGELELLADVSALPPLSKIEADHPYIGWTGTLRTSAPRKAVEDVFEFVVGDCDLQILESGAALVNGGNHADAPTDRSNAEQAAPPPQPLPPVDANRSERAEAGGEAADATKESRGSANKRSATTTRVDLDKIDRVVNMVGELIIAQAMLGQVVQGLPEEVSSRLSQVLDEVVHHTRELKESVMLMRAQPVGSVFQRMPRLVRELSAKTGKKVRLETFGEATEVDRTIVERLSDPLTHIIRNSVDHGIEPPVDRIAAGKGEEGTIRLSAAQRGGRIVIEISDDGGGVNCERVLKKAREKKLVDPEASLTDDEICNLIFLPGFSTADSISDISGRGVGMDVVRRNIQDLGGRVSLKSERGRGMSIQLAMPLTLAVMDGMVIKVGENIYVMPMSSIVECLHPRGEDSYDLLNTRGMLKLRGELVHLVYLGDLFNVPSKSRRFTECVVIITECGDGARIGLVVDELCGHQQVVIKSIEDSYGPVPGIAAATIFGNGRVALILDVEKLAELAVQGALPNGPAGATVAARFAS